jgi:hypothetical protein
MWMCAWMCVVPARAVCIGVAGCQEGKGEEFLADAERELKRFAPFSGREKKETAAGLLMKAGNSFKTSKRCT